MYDSFRQNNLCFKVMFKHSFKNNVIVRKKAYHPIDYIPYC